MSLRRSKLIQMVGNAAKLAGLASIAVLLFAHAQFSSLAASWHLPVHGGLLAFGIELVAVLWAYEGWHVVSFTGGEFKAPARDLPRSLIGGTLAVMAACCILNVAYYCVLSPSAIAAEPSVAAHAVGHVYGSIAARCVSGIVLVSILGALNGMILTGPRVFYAMARDGLFFARLGQLGKNTRVPSAAIIVQGIWASLLSLAGNFEQLFTCVVFTAWIFYGLCVAGLIVARFRLPHQPRPFRTPLYPLVPILFVCAAVAVIAATILAAPLRAAAGLAAILSGLPFYFLFQAKRRRTAATLLPEESEA
jgi:APA family basic amino acid/polyamine antiporter